MRFVFLRKEFCFLIYSSMFKRILTFVAAAAGAGAILGLHKEVKPDVPF